MTRPSDRARQGLALFDGLLLTVLAALIAQTWVGRPVPAAARAPAGFDPVRYAPPELARSGAGLGRVAPIWEQLDRPPPPAPAPEVEAAAPSTPPQGRLIMVSIDARQPERSAGIVEDAHGRQSAVFVGDDWQDGVVRRVGISQRDDGAVVSRLVLERRGQEQVLELVRE